VSAFDEQLWAVSVSGINAATRLRQQHSLATAPREQTEVELRPLTDYDAAFGLGDEAVS